MKETGIKNRNTVVNAIKILEAYGIIKVKHSKGKYPNTYILLDCSHWKAPNSINLNTVIKTKKKEKTISNSPSQQYQNQPPNSITDDTRNHISKSSKEIKGEENKDFLTPKIGDSDSEGLFPGTRVILGAYFGSTDISRAVEFLKKDGKPVSSKSVEDLLISWVKEGQIVQRKKKLW